MKLLNDMLIKQKQAQFFLKQQKTFMFVKYHKMYQYLNLNNFFINKLFFFLIIMHIFKKTFTGQSA